MIKELRIKKGWSQEELAEFSGLSVRTVQRIEQGAQPSRESLRALSSTFSIPQSELVSSRITPDPEVRRQRHFLEVFSSDATADSEELEATSKNAISWASIVIAAIWILCFFWVTAKACKLV